MADMLGYYNAASTRTVVRFAFYTTSRDGAPVAPLSAYEVGDIRIYKDGVDTQRTSTTGFTMTSPFDSLVGLHHVSIDLTDNSDAGFYAAGHWYMVVLAPDTETVDGLTAQAVLAYFEIGPNEVNVVQNAGTAITAASGVQEVKVASIANNALTAAAINADAITNAKIADDALAVENIKDGAVTAAKIADGALDAATLAIDLDVYQADVAVDIDSIGARNVWSAVWRKNGESINSGITSPTIWVYDDAGNDIIGSSASPIAMTQVGASGTYIYVATLTEMISTGIAYFARVRASIASATRTGIAVVSRDD